MAAGLPVVGWRAGTLPYLADEREAVLVPPGDVEGLSRALDLLAGDEPLRRRMGEAARRRARQRPTWRETAALPRPPRGASGDARPPVPSAVRRGRAGPPPFPRGCGSGRRAAARSPGRAGPSRPGG